MKFTEAKLEQTFAELLQNEGYSHSLGETLVRTADEVLIESDLCDFLLRKYGATTSRKSLMNKPVSPIGVSATT
jgi:hypothetical protein